MENVRETGNELGMSRLQRVMDEVEEKGTGRCTTGGERVWNLQDEGVLTP